MKQEKWDTHFCVKCNEWKEKNCGHSYSECSVDCINRPEKPIKRKVKVKKE